MSTEANELPAWLLSLGDGRRVVVADAHVVHLLVDAPVITPVPDSAAHCVGVFAWNERLLPALDLCRWMSGDGLDAEHSFYAILAARDAKSGEALVASVLLDEIPTRVGVSDADARDLQQIDSALRTLALTAIEIEGQVLPILDVLTLLSKPLQSVQTLAAVSPA